MADEYLLYLRTRFKRRLAQLSARARHDPQGKPATELGALLDALDALRDGREREFDGERLGYSTVHVDLRDCAELKVPVTREYNAFGRPLGPSHRLIYREFEPLPGDTKPIREPIAFGRRANGEVFRMGGDELGRVSGREVSALQELPNSVPALGPNKEPNRPLTPVRMPLPPDIAAAISTAVGSSPAKRATSVPVTTRNCRSPSPRDSGRQ